MLHIRFIQIVILFFSLGCASTAQRGTASELVGASSKPGAPASLIDDTTCIVPGEIVLQHHYSKDRSMVCKDAELIPLPVPKGTGVDKSTGLKITGRARNLPGDSSDPQSLSVEKRGDLHYVTLGSLGGRRGVNISYRSNPNADKMSTQNYIHVGAIQQNGKLELALPPLRGGELTEVKLTPYGGGRELYASVDLRDPINPTDLIDPNTPEYDGVGRKVVFSDEFKCEDFERRQGSGGGIDPKRWNTEYSWGSETVINGEEQFYVSPQNPDHAQIGFSPFSCADDKLIICSTPTPEDKKRFVGGRRLMSGVINSKGKFATRYGSFEAKMKVPVGGSGFPAFWLYAEAGFDQNTQRSEIDIMEMLTGRCRDEDPNPYCVVFQAGHYFDDVNNGNGGVHHHIKKDEVQFDNRFISTSAPNAKKFTDDFHTFSTEWEPGKVKWLIDGHVVNTYIGDKFDFEPLHPIANLARGGTWDANRDGGGSGPLNHTDFDTSGPYTPRGDCKINGKGTIALEIEHIRVYQKDSY